MLLFARIFIAFFTLVCIMTAGYEIGTKQYFKSFLSLVFGLGYGTVLYVLLYR